MNAGVNLTKAALRPIKEELAVAFLIVERAVRADDDSFDDAVDLAKTRLRPEAKQVAAIGQVIKRSVRAHGDRFHTAVDLLQGRGTINKEIVIAFALVDDAVGGHD